MVLSQKMYNFLRNQITLDTKIEFFVGLFFLFNWQEY